MSVDLGVQRIQPQIFLDHSGTEWDMKSTTKPKRRIPRSRPQISLGQSFVREAGSRDAP